jgi:hypothetical protein
MVPQFLALGWKGKHIVLEIGKRPQLTAKRSFLDPLAENRTHKNN